MMPPRAAFTPRDQCAGPSAHCGGADLLGSRRIENVACPGSPDRAPARTRGARGKAQPGSAGQPNSVRAKPNSALPNCGPVEKRHPNRSPSMTTTESHHPPDRLRSVARHNPRQQERFLQWHGYRPLSTALTHRPECFLAPLCGPRSSGAAHRRPVVCASGAGQGCSFP